MIPWSYSENIQRESTMHIDVLPIGPIQTNCYIVTCRESRQAAVIDPGWNDPMILETIRRRDATVVRIVNTHAHWDHIGGNAALVQATGAPLYAPVGDLALLRARGGVLADSIGTKPRATGL
jgi:glyoxylase-like metal-dependent hydrolase (beta-lactamase superfamily II)